MAKSWGDAWRDYTGPVKGDPPVIDHGGTLTIAATPKRSKYGAKKTQVDGLTFDSAKEARRYSELRLLEQAGEIRELTLQYAYPLHAYSRVKGEPIGVYKCDFRYRQGPTGVLVVEDVKGVRTALYRWKKKHVEAQYGITITEV